MLQDAIRNFVMVESVFWKNLIVACHGHFLQANFGNDVRIDVFAEVTLVNSQLKIFFYKFREEAVLEFLDDLPCITMDRSLSPALHDAISTLYRQARIRMHAVSSADNVLGHLRLVQEGLGFALLPDSMGALLPPGVVLKELKCNPAPTVSIVVAWKMGNTSPLVSAFVDLVYHCVGNSKDVARLTHRRTKS